MSDDLGKKGAQDRSRINMNEKWEVQYWTRELGVDEETLRNIVQRVGASADKVRSELSSRP
jgi:hypothetical protein